MKRLCMAVLCSLVFAGMFTMTSAATRDIEVSGLCKDALTDNPVPEVSVFLAAINPLTFNPANLATLKYDTLRTGYDGMFDYIIKADPAATILAYGVQKNGYVLQYNFVSITSTIMFLEPIIMQRNTNLVTDQISVSGTVVDSTTGQPVAGAVVSMSGFGKLDTTGNSTVTGADGKFSKQVSIKNLSTQKLLLWAVTKTGYNASAGQLPVSGTTMDLGTIKISTVMKIANTIDTLQVSGTVVDDATGSPIANAKVVMSGLGADTAGNTAMTGADGKFSKQVIVTNLSAFKALVYVVSKTGCTPNGGQVVITSKTIDLGTIKLVGPTGTINSNLKSVATAIRANNIQIYSLRGQLLYAGALVAPEKVVQNRTPVIVNYRINNRTINSVKVVTAK